MNPIKIKWVIKGYHVFRRRPEIGERLIVTKENGNRYDPNAMKVNLPGDEEGPNRGVHVGAQVGTTIIYDLMSVFSYALINMIEIHMIHNQ